MPFLRIGKKLPKRRKYLRSLMAAATLKIALVGNPNSGKSSLFNALTGLRQKVGNFPGVTVDKKTGTTRLDATRQATIIDLPGTYSLYPKSADELVTCEVLLNPQDPHRPDLIIIIADAANLRRNLLFATQIMDLRTPTVIALTMADIARKQGLVIDVPELERRMGVPVVEINPRRNKGMAELKRAVSQLANFPAPPRGLDFIDLDALVGVGKMESSTSKLPANAPAGHPQGVPLRAKESTSLLPKLQTITGAASPYAALHAACNHTELHYLSAAQRIQIGSLLGEHGFQKTRMQADEILARYQKIGHIMQACVSEQNTVRKTVASERLDRTLLHPVWGHVILLAVLFLLFQSIFWLAAYPMDWIESLFAWIGGGLEAALPKGLLTDLLVNGVVAGISGVVVFIPQIMVLFGFITVLEDTGYMARISFLTDRLMRSVGLGGRSVMPLISGMACAVPAVMAARTIQNRKERLITILVTPLMSCSARLPVYTILIALVVPDVSFLGIFNLHGVVLMGLYLLGFAGALVAARVMSLFIKIRERSFFLMELPVYRAPRWRNVGTTMLEKARVFVTDAGKVIMVISLVLWGLSTFGPPSPVLNADRRAAPPPDNNAWIVRAPDLEHSYAGIIGHSIEPAIRPLGYDWKIGIALITSFAAREVFVGTMATLYSVGEDGGAELPLREKMRQAHRPDGSIVYTPATGISLVIFYVFAMQCMSTMAIVKRETRSWKWPLIQFAFMLVMAWVGAWAAFKIVGALAG